MQSALRVLAAVVAAGGVVAAGAVAAAPKALSIYFIDVEGGQSTLVVTPSGESLLIDAGFPDGGGFQAIPGDPAKARDANRIVRAARDAGLSRIDYLLITHFHGDHDGGVVELSQLMPIGTFIDHDTVPAEGEAVGGTLDLFRRYAEVRAKRRHVVPKPGDRLPLGNPGGASVTVVSSAGATLTAPLPGAGAPNLACTSAASLPAQEKIENPRSTGVLVQFGRFRFLDVGDLSGEPLHALACPTNLIGPVDVYLVAHHGGPDAADRATVAAWKPRAAISNNGAAKGGVPELFATLRDMNVDWWQLHRSTDAGARNAADDRIANLDETAAYWIKVEAAADGSFVLTNQRTGVARRFSASSSTRGR
ncbi:MAG TPA: MBL fold metallo-hydrolase [Vicinamibacterales bacterium]|nr:MBL fold metallo-hydrolase [Vicinamibacterales bacterium]